MNRTLPLLAVLILALASCSRGGAARPQLGLAVHSLDDSASAAIRKSLETQALDRADLAIVDGQNQQAAEDLQVDSLYRKGLGALAVDPVDGKSLASMIDKAKTERVPIVFFDRRPSDEAMRSWDKLFFVGSTDADAGTAEGEILASFWKANAAADRNKDGSIQFLILASDQGAELGQFLEGFTARLAALGLKSERLDAGADLAAGASALLAKFSDRVEALVCADPAAAQQALEALKAGSWPKSRKALPIVSLGSGKPSPAIVDAIKSGALLGAAYEDLEGEGKAVFDLAYALARGRDPSRAGWRIVDAKYVWVAYRKYTNLSPSLASP
jgi:methyl-galactoside transport system substrate-binding protein